MAIRFLSRQAMWGITGISSSFWIFAASFPASALALAIGESARVIKSAPACFSISAPFKTFPKSAEKGGSNSTIKGITPAEIFFKKQDCTLGKTFSSLFAIFFFPLGTDSNLSLNARIYSGVVPQHPPKISTPRPATCSMVSTKYSLLSPYRVFPRSVKGYPALGSAVTYFSLGNAACFKRRNRWAAPTPQLKPYASTVSIPAAFSIIFSRLMPSLVYPLLSTANCTSTKTSPLDLIYSVISFKYAKSVWVSKTKMSAPQEKKVSQISLYSCKTTSFPKNPVS